MHMLKFFTIAAMVLATSLKMSNADDAVWRSTRPLKVEAASSSVGGNRADAQTIWERIEYPQLIQHLQTEVEQARGAVEFWELRLRNYKPLRFTDATQTAIKYAENALQAARRQESASTHRLATVRRHRIALGELRTRMLQRSAAYPQIGW